MRLDACNCSDLSLGSCFFEHVLIFLTCNMIMKEELGKENGEERKRIILVYGMMVIC